MLATVTSPNVDDVGFSQTEMDIATSFGIETQALFRLLVALVA